MTQQQLGEKLNVSYQAVSKWENDISEPDLSTIEKMVEIFDISMADFFEMAKDPEHSDSKTLPEVVESKKVSDIKKSLIQSKPWYLAIGLGVLIVIFALCALLIPVKYSSSEIYSMVDPSVFCITAEGSFGQSAGSGFFINNKGLAVTNYHVIKNCTSGKVQLSNGETYDILKIVGCDEDKDIAIIQIDIESSKSVKIGDSNKIKVGDVVYAIGYPESFQLGSANSTFTQGIISKVSYTYEDNTYIQTTVDMTRGNSGGVLLNSQGEVIGITTMMLTDGIVDYMNMAIPINRVDEVEHDLNMSLLDYYERNKVFYFYSDGQVIHSLNFIRGDMIKKIDDPTKLGYIFEGWYETSEYTKKFDFDSPVYDKTQCFAKWTPISYTIKFNANGGTGEMSDVVATYDQALTLPSLTFSNPHHNFVKWERQDNKQAYSNNQSIFNLTTQDKATIILDAIWEIQKYTIIFDGNNAQSGEMSNLVLEYDQVIDLPKNQYEKQGYIFEGWAYDDKVYQDMQEVSKLCETEGTITLTAKWQPISYVVRYEFEGQSSYEQTFYYDQPQSLLPATFEKPYHTFTYWYCESERLKFDDQVQIFNLTSTQGEVFIFTANFRENIYTVRYNPSTEVDLNNCVEVQLKYSQEIQSRACMFTKLGYNFSHWVDEYGNIYERSMQYIDGKYVEVGTPISKLTPVDQDVVDFFAVWEMVTYKVFYRYKLKSGTKDVELGTFAYEDEIVLLQPQYIDDGYEFEYWLLRPNWETAMPGDVVSRLSTQNTYDAYIEAVYKPKLYTINFDGNGATKGEMQPVEATFDSEVTLPQNEFIKDGYTFYGWKYEDQIYTTNNIGIPISAYAESITLTAVWLDNLKGEGTFSNPYTISTIEDINQFFKLSQIHQFKNSHVVLQNDIDCGFTKLPSTNFAGVFDGKGHKLINVDYQDGTLFQENSGVILNFGIENLKIDLVNENDSVYVYGLAKLNKGYISRCHVKGDITVSSTGSVYIYGFVGSNASIGAQRQIEYCFANLSVNISSDSDIDTCLVYGFAGGSNYNVDYNYSVLSLTANLKIVNNLIVNAYGSKNDHSFAKANIDVSVDNANNYNFSQTATYYSDDSYIKVLIGGKSVPKLVEKVTALSNLTNKQWMEENLFDVSGAWIYDSINFPMPSYTFQKVIETQEQFISLNNGVLVGDYILNCDIDLSENNNFRIAANYGSFDGNGHVIKNYSLTENDYKNNYGLFEKNFGTIKNLGVDNLLFDLHFRDLAVNVAGLVVENWGTVNACFVRGDIEALSIDSDCIVGGIVAISRSGEVLNSYSDVSVYASATSGAYSDVKANAYSGGIIAIGEGKVENCYSVKDVVTYAHYANGTLFSAYGISGADGIVKNSFVLSNVAVSEYNSSGKYQAGGISKEFENSFAYEWQTVTVIEEDLSFGDKSYDEFCSLVFLEALDFEQFVSKENLLQNENAVWVITETDLPKLWFEEEGNL